MSTLPLKVNERNKQKRGRINRTFMFLKNKLLSFFFPLYFSPQMCVLNLLRNFLSPHTDLVTPNSIPVGDYVEETWGMPVTFPCPSPKQCSSHPPLCLNFSLSLIFTVSVCLSKRRVTLGTPLNDRRIRMELSRGVSGNRGTW